MIDSISELIAKLNTTDEHERIEAKGCKNGTLGKATLKTISAFSNEPDLDGGYIVFGVERDGDGVYQVVGVDDPDKLQLELTSACNSQFNEKLRPRIWVEQVGGKNVVAAYISEIDPSRKPVFRKASGLPKGAFRRLGSSDIRFTSDDVAQIFDLRQTQSFDAIVVTDATMTEDFDEDAIESYRSRIEKYRPDSWLLELDSVSLLRSLKCIKKRNHEWIPTVAGLLLFGSKLALRREFPMAARVDYIRVPGNLWVEDPDERYEAIEFREPLVSGIRRIIAAVLDDIPRAVSIGHDSLERRETPRVPSSVVREAIVNAVMHRNYRNHQPTQIIRFANRIEIQNAGYSLKPHDELGTTGSRPRNPVLASVLHDLQLAESKGTGINAMRREMKQAGLTAPAFVSDRENDQFSVTFRLKHFLSEENLHWLASLDAEWKLDDDEKYALVYVREKGSITNSELRDVTGHDTLAASHKLRRLRDLQLLRKEGAGSATFYTPGQKFIGAAVVEGAQRNLEELISFEPSADEPDKLLDEPDKLADEPDKLADKPDKLADEPDKLADEPDKQEGRHLLTELPTELRERIEVIRPLKRAKNLEDLISELCKIRAFTSSEIAEILNRNRRNLNTAYITPLVERGVLERLYPESPRHPNQAYRTADSDKE